MIDSYSRTLLKKRILVPLVLIVLLSLFSIQGVIAADLDGVLKSGTLRHLGIPYANFVVDNQTGLDVELMQAFAKHLGVKYQFVSSSWSTIIPELTGSIVKPVGDNIKIIGSSPIKGDVISTGFTVLPWREKIVNFSETTFPSGIWLIARGDSSLTPISPSGDIDNDINQVRDELDGVAVLGLAGSCLEPNLYHIKETGAKVEYFSPDRDLEEMIPAVIAKQTDSTLMDVPVALIALQTWPGQIKVVGPLSEEQSMATAFSKDSPKLKQEFDKFFSEFKAAGGYRTLVEKYYLSVFVYYPDFL